MDEQTDNISEELDFGTDEQVAPDAASQTDESTDIDASESTEERGESDDSTDVGGNTGEDTNNSAQDASEYEGFLRNKGIDPADPKAMDKLAEMAMNSEKKMYEVLNQRNLESQVGQPQQLNPSDTIALAEVRGMQMQMQARDFKQRTNLSDADEQKMVEYLEQPIRLPDGNTAARKELVGAGLLSLDEVYKLSVGVTESAAAAKENLRKAVLKDVASSRNAKRPTASATNSTEFADSKDDPFLSAFSD